ncbi:MAG: DUF1707 domain-containing protein [Micropruina sp.]|nr:DUF1707 domain-containing protein [Micropruina sp.]
MSSSPWQNLPQRPERPLPTWAMFVLDPRRREHRGLRAADADRTLAADILTEAHVQGRLSADEFSGRLDQAASARSLGVLVPLLDDLLLPDRSPAAAPVRSRRRTKSLAGFMQWMLMLNLIYFLTALMAGGLYYYWPIWPLVIMGVPWLVRLITGAFEGRAARGRAARESYRQLPGSDDLR